jgi:DNA-binding ferritin-like protein (Dps family)
VREYLVDTGLLEEQYAKDLEDIVKFHKGYEHGEIKSITGKELDEWIERTKRFVIRFEKLLKHLENQKKAEEIRQLTDFMLKISATALKSIDKLPKNPKDLPEAIEKHLIGSGLVSPNYSGLLEKILKLQKSVDQNKISEISENDLYSNRDYVRRFMLDVRNVLREKKFVSKREQE